MTTEVKFNGEVEIAGEKEQAAGSTDLVTIAYAVADNLIEDLKHRNGFHSVFKDTEKMNAEAFEQMRETWADIITEVFVLGFIGGAEEKQES